MMFPFGEMFDQLMNYDGCLNVSSAVFVQIVVGVPTCNER